MHQYPTHRGDVTSGDGMSICWQQGPIGGRFNGATAELVIRAAILRMTDLQAAMPCEENRQVIEHLNAALGALDARTRDRYQRGVLGTAAP